MSKKYAPEKVGFSMTKILFVAIGIISSIAAAASSLGYVTRTATPPLMQITLTEPGCEYVAKVGIPVEKANSNCTIKVRYKKVTLSDSGDIALPQGRTLQINNSQIVGMTQIDDGNDEPWTEAHKRAGAFLLASMVAMLLLILVMVRPTRH